MKYVLIKSVNVDPDFKPSTLKPGMFIKDLDESEWFLVVKNDGKNFYITDTAGSAGYS